MILVAGVILISLSGCIFLRLLEVKRQLSDFDANFRVDIEDGLSLTFLHPVILEKDLFFVGLPPTLTEPDETGTTWTHIFEKQYPDDPTEDSNFDLSLSSRFADSKLNEIRISERYFAFVSKQNVLHTIRSFGNADLDVAERTASMDVTDGDPSPGVAPPEVVDILNTLGLPYARADSAGERWFEYRYRLLPPVSEQANNDSGKSAKLYRFKFTFSKTNRISRIEGNLPLLGQVNISYK